MTGIQTELSLPKEKGVQQSKGKRSSTRWTLVWFVHHIHRGTVLPSVFSSQKKKKYSIVTLPQTSSSSTLHIPMNVWPYDVWVCLFFFFSQSHVGKVHEVQYSYGFMHVGVLFWQGCVRRTQAYVGWIVSTIAVGLRNEN